MNTIISQLLDSKPFSIDMEKIREELYQQGITSSQEIRKTITGTTQFSDINEVYTAKE